MQRDEANTKVLIGHSLGSIIAPFFDLKSHPEAHVAGQFRSSVPAVIFARSAIQVGQIMVFRWLGHCPVAVVLGWLLWPATT